MNRSQLRKKIAMLKNKIAALENELNELAIQDMLLCDKKQWFTEGIETSGKNGRIKDTIGRINWVEIFVDDNDGTSIKVPRSKVVRINGYWI